MKTGRLLVMTLLALLGMVVMFLSANRSHKAQAKNGDAKRGEYLVRATGCGDCHTPLKMTMSDPSEPDASRAFSGHPENLTMPPAPALTMPWAGAFSYTMTAWSGPWGTSYAANITPDRDTGLGEWSDDDFIRTIRTGRHKGVGRPILPPMPIPSLQNLDDADLGSIIAFLRTTQPVPNRVPDPLPPEVKRIEP